GRRLRARRRGPRAVEAPERRNLAVGHRVRTGARSREEEARALVDSDSWSEVMRSITGFGVGEAPLCTDEATGAQGRLTVEIRAVNHRFLDVRVRGPSQVPDLTTAVETLARERLTRGRFDVNVRIDGAALGAMVIDQERARSVFRSLSELRDELAPGEPLPLAILGSVPDLFVPKIEEESEKLRAALTAAFD